MTQRATRSRGLPPSSQQNPTVAPEGEKKKRGRPKKQASFVDAEAALVPEPEPEATRSKVTSSTKGTKSKAKGPKAEGKKNNSYVFGQYGAREREQTRLGERFGIPVSGSTHEAEHTIGFEPLNQTSGNKRKENTEARSLENRAWAYQEVEPFHAAHIGTGTRPLNQTGFSSESYRDTQRALVESGDVSSAVQINQLGYGFQKQFRKGRGGKASEIADDSYDTMVTNMDKVSYADGVHKEREVPVDAKQRVEMYLARRAAQTRCFPSVEEENKARKLFGVTEYEPPKATEPETKADEAEAPKDETPKDETPKDETPKDETPEDESPQAKVAAARGRVDETIALHPKDPYAQVDPRVTESLQAALVELRELWNAMSDEARSADTSVITTLDRYYMTVQHRRPPQQAMYQQQGFKPPARG